MDVGVDSFAAVVTDPDTGAVVVLDPVVLTDAVGGEADPVGELDLLQP